MSLMIQRSLEEEIKVEEFSSMMIELKYESLDKVQYYMSLGILI